jgi:hypothetical protein
MYFFSKTENKYESGPFWGLVPVGRRGYKEMVKQGGYGRNIMYLCMKMEK